jgi:hypothetical protein
MGWVLKASQNVCSGAQAHPLMQNTCCSSDALLTSPPNRWYLEWLAWGSVDWLCSKHKVRFRCPYMRALLLCAFLTCVHLDRAFSFPCSCQAAVQRSRQLMLDIKLSFVFISGLSPMRFKFIAIRRARLSNARCTLLLNRSAPNLSAVHVFDLIFGIETHESFQSCEQQLRCIQYSHHVLNSASVIKASASAQETLERYHWSWLFCCLSCGLVTSRGSGIPCIN